MFCLFLFRLLAARGMAKSTTQMWIPALEITYLIVILEQHMRYLFVMVYLRFLKNSFLEANVTIIYVPITIFVYTLYLEIRIGVTLFGNQSSSRLKCLIPEDSFWMNLFPTCSYSRYFRYFYMCRTMQIELRGHANFYHIVLWHQFIYLKFHQLGCTEIYTGLVCKPM